MFSHSHHQPTHFAEILKKVDLLVFAKRNESQCHKFFTSYFFFYWYCCFCCEEGWKLKYELQLAPDRFLHYGRKLGNSFFEHLQQQSLIKISAEEQKIVCFFFCEKLFALHSDFLEIIFLKLKMFKKSIRTYANENLSPYFTDESFKSLT